MRFVNMNILKDKLLLLKQQFLLVKKNNIVFNKKYSFGMINFLFEKYFSYSLEDFKTKIETYFVTFSNDTMRAWFYVWCSLNNKDCTYDEDVYYVYFEEIECLKNNIINLLNFLMNNSCDLSVDNLAGINISDGIFGEDLENIFRMINDKYEMFLDLQDIIRRPSSYSLESFGRTRK